MFQESSLVAESTRRQVLVAAEELGYVYNRRAASLRMQRSNTVGLLIAGLSNPFFADLVEGVEEELYNLDQDPWELNNIVDDPACQDVADQLDDRLIRWMRQTGDPLLAGPITPARRTTRHLDATDDLPAPTRHIPDEYQDTRNDEPSVL